MSDASARIKKYIDSRPGPAEACLTETGVSVWALVAYLRGSNGDVPKVARDYDIPEEAVRAAFEYYKRHKEVIDARLAMNAA